jgi:hypothetical protein
MRMDWKLLWWRIRDAVRDCDAVQFPAQLQITKESVMEQYAHDFSLRAELRQHAERCKRFVDFSDKPR